MLNHTPFSFTYHHF